MRSPRGALPNFIGSFFFVLILPASSFAQWRGYGDGWRMGPGMMGDWGMGWFSMIFMIVFWILVIVALVYLVKWLAQGSRGEKPGIGGSSGSRAIEILKERYARGEIDKAEFDARKKDLMD